MREIKFRGLDEEMQKMVYDFQESEGESFETWKQNYLPIVGDDGTLVIGVYHNGDWHELKMMQYIGKKDKNENEIYAGDIVKFHYFYQSLGEGLGVRESEHELTGIVEWGEFGWGLSAIKGEHWEGYTGYESGEGSSTFLELMAMNQSSIHEESFEVIGNFYENEKLINAS